MLPDPLYYLNNFRSVLASLQKRYGELLSAEEREFITLFATLPVPSCALMVRMFMRRGTFFRLSRLRYAEIGDTAAAAEPLLRVRWLEEPVLDAAALHRLLTKSELLDHLALPQPLHRLKKTELLAMLREQCPDSQPFRGWCAHSPDRVFHPLVKPLAERFRLMFFGNFRQDWTEFVLADLGITSYESVPGRSAAFRTRAQIEVFHQLYRCRRDLDEGMALEKVLAAIPLPIADSDWLEDLRQRLLFKVAAAYERSDVAAALAVLSACRHRGARMRSALLLERLGEWRAAYDLCLAARSNPQNEAERQHVLRLLPRLSRRLGLTAEKTTPVAVASFHVVLKELPEEPAVEMRIRDHLQDGSHTSVHYVENGLINSLFGLLCWDAIFAPIPGAFFHDFQYGPADLKSGYFYERRGDRFAECFAALESRHYEGIIRRRFVEKAGIQSPFVAWGLLSAPLLELALACFPAADLRRWFEWIVRDVMENCTGFPDLVQFWPDERRYRLIEVKGPGDRLQDNQRRFLEFCTEQRMPVSVCRVSFARGRQNPAVPPPSIASAAPVVLAASSEAK
jgi:hypothetical protein